MDRQVTSQSVEETQQFAERLVGELPPGSVLALHGNLGAGKTTFVQGLAAGLNIETIVNSPTYTIINVYQRGSDGQVLHHVDAYRLETPEALWSTGIDDIFEAGGPVLIEWPERIQAALPTNRLWVDIQLDDDNPDRRLFMLTSHGNNHTLLNLFRRAIYGF